MDISLENSTSNLFKIKIILSSLYMDKKAKVCKIQTDNPIVVVIENSQVENNISNKHCRYNSFDLFNHCYWKIHFVLNKLFMKVGVSYQYIINKNKKIKNNSLLRSKMANPQHLNRRVSLRPQCIRVWVWQIYEIQENIL